MKSPLTIPEAEAIKLIKNAQATVVQDRIDQMTQQDWNRILVELRNAEERLPEYWEVVERSLDGIKCFSHRLQLSAILSGCREDDGKLWMHFSLSARRNVPNWEQMVKAKNIFLGEDTLAVQVFPRKANYVNIHRYVLHLWRCLDEDPVPDFSSGSGTI